MAASSSTFWNSPDARRIAKEIDSVPGIYCGPAAVAWIAAVWSAHAGVNYDFVSRLRSKELLPDGPRPFQLNLPGFQLCLDDLLQRETNHALRLSVETFYRTDSISNALTEGFPVIVRVTSPKLKDGLHYITLFESESKKVGDREYIRFHFQDNGVFKGHHPIGPGLGVTQWFKTTKFHFLGAKAVTLVQSDLTHACNFINS